MSVGAEEKPSFVERGFGYFRGLASAFGWRYCAIVALVYGVNQGMGETFLFQAQKYYFFDTIKVNASRYSQIDGFTNIPWQIKAIYGMISDSYSIGGRRRTPYMIVAGFCGVGASLGLWLIPPQQLVATVLSVLANFSIASPDVMIDASAAERAKTHPHLTADLQSLCWGSLHVCSFFSHVVVGYLLAPNILGPRGVFALFSLTSLANLLPAMANWLGEKRTSEHTGEGQRHEVMNPLSSTDDDLRVAVEDPPVLYFEDLAKKRARQLPAFLAALCTCGVSVAIGAIQVFYQGPDPTLVAASTTVALGCFLCVSLYVLLKKVDRDLAGVAVFVFLVGCFQPLTDVIFDWSHDDGEKYGRCSKKCEDRDDDGECGWAIDRDYPCISKSYYGHMLALAELFGVVGIVIYNVYMSEWSFRSTFGFVQLLYFAANLIDILWVARINLALGIPDELMLCGLEIIQPICRLIHLMPLMVLAAKVCPKDLEATLFALLMGLSNFGSVVGLYNGGALLHVYGVDQPDFNNLSVFVFTRTLLFLVPILFLGLLPKGGPKDRLDHEAEDEEDDDDGGSYKVPTTSRAPSEIELMQPGGASVEDANGGDDSGVHMITEEEKR